MKRSMTGSSSRLLPRVLAMASLAVVLSAQPSSAQGLFDLFNNDRDRPREDVRRGAPDRGGAERGGPAERDPAVEMERLEARIRQLTGEVEQLQFRNRQLEQQLQAGGGAPVAPGGGGGVRSGSVAPLPPGGGQSLPPLQSQPGPVYGGVQPQPSYVAPAPVQSAAPGPGGRRSDAFDPSQSPAAPGAPRSLTSSPPGSNAAPPPVIIADEPVGAPGGRGPGGPLDLSGVSDRAGGPAGVGGALPPPPSRANPNATGMVASVQPPSNSPKDAYDLAYGYILRKDYALAEEAFDGFIKRHPSDRLAPEARFWLGESLFQRQRYDAAAERFLDVTTKYASSPKAADALLRLGQSLAQLGQKDMACSALAEVNRKYPRASGSVKQGVDREQKRARCL